MISIADTGRNLSNQIRLGVVTAIGVQNSVCRVLIGGIETDFIPWLVPFAGGVIHWSPPTTGEQVLVLNPDGDTHGGVVLRGLYSDSFPAPSSSESETMTVFPDGAIISYDHESHALKATLPSGGTAELTADAGLTINGPVTVNGHSQFNGDMAISGTATADVDVVGGGKSLKGHKHLGVQTGGGVTGVPQ